LLANPPISPTLPRTPVKPSVDFFFTFFITGRTKIIKVISAVI
jgi:hypothetical protein